MYRLTHQTEYRYSNPVDIANHVACLRPRALPCQQLVEFELTIDPEPAMFIERTDFFGNTQQIFSIQKPHRALRVHSRCLVDVIGGQNSPTWGAVAWDVARNSMPADRTEQGLDAFQFCFESPRIPIRSGLAGYALQSFTPARPLREALLELTERIYQDFTFKPSATNVSTTVDEVFARRVGVCQDFAHLQIACLRSIGLAARYVSGYLRTIPPPGRQRLVGADASHAWLSVYCPGDGWLCVDPTNNLIPNTDHVLLAWGRDYSDVSPLRGLILGGGMHDLKVAVDMDFA